MSDQIPLFELAREDAADPSVSAVARIHEEARSIAADLPSEIHFGTSSWSFPGWKGIVYSGAVSAGSIAKDGLRQYSSHPLLRTVGIDRSYYAPIPLDDLRRYAEQLPDGFKACAKAPAAVTSTTIGPPDSAAPNSDFMSVDRLIDEQLAPFSLSFSDHTGPFILEFPPFPRYLRMEPAEFPRATRSVSRTVASGFSVCSRTSRRAAVDAGVSRDPRAPWGRARLQLLERDAGFDGSVENRAARGSPIRRDPPAIAAWNLVSGSEGTLPAVQRAGRAGRLDAARRCRSERPCVDERSQALGIGEQQGGRLVSAVDHGIGEASGCAQKAATINLTAIRAHETRFPASRAEVTSGSPGGRVLEVVQHGGILGASDV